MLVLSLFIVTLQAEDITSFVGNVEMDVTDELGYEVSDLSSDEVVSFEETPTVEAFDEIKDLQDIPLAKTIIVEDVKEIVVKKEPVIIDDLHSVPTVIKMSDYRDEASLEPVVKKALKVSTFTSENTKIVKYINPQMRKFNLSIPQNKIGFWSLLNEAMQKSASLILKNHDIAITKANLAILKSEYYPNLSLNYYNQYYHGYSRNGNSNIGGSVYPSTSEYRDSLNLSVDYEIFRFGARDLKVEMANVDMAILRSEIELEKEKIAKELLENFTSALKAQEIIRMKQKTLLVKNILLENTQRLYDAGFASKTDIATLRIDEVAIEKQMLSSKLRILDALKNIQILSNVKVDTNKMSLAMLEPSPVPIKGFEQTAKANNIKLQIDKKVKEMELVKKEYYPTLLANGEYQLYGSDRTKFFDAIGDLERNHWNIGVILKWDIFNGYKTNNTIEKTKLEIEKLAEQYRLEKITFEAKKEKRELLKQMIATLLSEESVLLNETGIQKELLTRLQKAGNISIMEVDKIEVQRLQSELDFKLQVVDQVYEDILSQLVM